MNISENLQRILVDKQNIANAINDKGVTCSVSESLDTYADKISRISGGGGVEPVIKNTDPLTFVNLLEQDSNIDCSISITETGSVPTKLIQYSINGGEWKDYQKNEKIFLHKKFDYVQFKSPNSIRMASSTSAYRTFKTIGLFKCLGSLNSLSNNVSLPVSASYNYFYYKLFENALITTVPYLQGSNLPQYAYAYLFSNCKFITDASSILLSYTTSQVGTYQRMFSSCENLTEPCRFSSTSNAAGNSTFDYMFASCNLTKCPTFSLTTTVTYCCRGMFYNCKSLNDASNININFTTSYTIADYSFYNMFYGCSNLTIAPKLKFTKITSSGNTMYGMFQNCSSLKELYCNVQYVQSTTLTTSLGTNWLSGVPNTTDCIFHKNPDWTGPTSRTVNTIPSNWQIVDWVQ